MMKRALLLLMVLASPALPHDGHDHGAAEVVRFPSEQLLAPNVPIVEADGRQSNFVDRFGNAGPVIITFTYSSCTTVCPVANAVLAQVQHDLPGVTLLTVSIDPTRDTPEVMARAAQMFEAGPGWHWIAATEQGTADLMAAFGIPRGPLDEHDPAFLIGDIGTGQFVRVAGLPAPDELTAIAGSVLTPT